MRDAVVGTVILFSVVRSSSDDFSFLWSVCFPFFLGFLSFQLCSVVLTSVVLDVCRFPASRIFFVERGAPHRRWFAQDFRSQSGSSGISSGPLNLATAVLMLLNFITIHTVQLNHLPCVYWTGVVFHANVIEQLVLLRALLHIFDGSNRTWVRRLSSGSTSLQSDFPPLA